MNISACIEGGIKQCGKITLLLLFMMVFPFAADSKQYIDLRIHLDGAITPNIAKELAALQGIDVPNDGELLRLLTVSDDCKSLKSSGIKGSLILCCMRGAEDDKNYETVDIARKYLVEDGGVAAVDLAGAEALYPTRDYREIFRRAKDYGAKRIGHGVRSEEDLELLQLIKNKGIVLEMCPTSNKLTHAVQDMNTYHLRRSHLTA